MRSACLDSNLLVLLLIGQTRPDLIGKHRRVERYGPGDMVLLTDHLSQYAEAVTTDPVITEVSNLIGTRRAEAAAVLAHLRTVVSRTSVLDVAAAEACDHPGFVRYGYTDTVLTVLAGEGVTIITDDLPLAGSLAKQDLPVINFSHLRFARR